MERKDIHCPRCNSSHVSSEGPSWKCKDCGRKFLKEYKPRKVKIPTPSKSYTDKKGKRKYFKKCCLCGECIRDNKDLRYEKVDITTLGELTGKTYTRNTAGLSQNRTFHGSCLKKLDIPTQRRFLLQDYRYRLLSANNGIWISLSPEGEEIFSSITSDNEKIDKKLQKLKQKGIKNWSKEEKAWFRGVINA